MYVLIKILTLNNINTKITPKLLMLNNKNEINNST